METLDLIIKALSGAYELPLKQPIPGKQLVLMTDASFRSVGFAIMIEDNHDQKVQSKWKTYNPWRLDRKFPPLRSSRCPYTQKSFWKYAGIS